MAKRKIETGLGRGLDALFGDPDLPAQGEGSVSLPISQVEPGLNQPRKRFDPESLADLAESIRVHGVIQPLTVRRLSSGYYQIIAGERRWRAAKAAGLDQVPAVIIEADDRKVMELGLIENLQREDLNPVEEAQGYQVLMQDYGLTQEQVAQRMGKSRPAITNMLRLLALPEEVLALDEEEQLSADTPGHSGRPHRRSAAPGRPAGGGAPAVRPARPRPSSRPCKRGKSPPKSPMAAPTWPSIWARWRRACPAPWAGKSPSPTRGKKGRIQLEYYDDQDLESLLALLQQHNGEVEPL